jgi:hypothetical protein
VAEGDGTQIILTNRHWSRQVLHIEVLQQLHSPPTAEKMYENGCTNFRRRMYDFFCGLGESRAQRFFRLLRSEAARLVRKLRAGARRASALGGRLNGLAGLAVRPKGEGRRACK